MFITISVGRLPLLAYITYYLPSVASKREKIQYHINPHTIVFYNLTCVAPCLPHAVDPAVAEELPADTVAPPGVAHVHSAAWGAMSNVSRYTETGPTLLLALGWFVDWSHHEDHGLRAPVNRNMKSDSLPFEVNCSIYLFRRCCIYLVILIFSGSTIVLAERKVSMLSAFNIDFMAAA